MELKDKVALITGGARIGQTIATELAARGCHIALSYRSSKKANDETVANVKSLGVNALSIQADLIKEEVHPQILSEIKKTFGRIDILVNMASLYQKTPLEGLTSEQWNAQIGTDLQTAYSLGLLAGNLMRQKGEGRIILFSDWVAASGRPRYKDFIPYYISKRGILGVVEALALEFAPEILVNGIAPGPILKPPDLSDAEDAEIKRVTPLGRWGGPKEIAKTVIFLIETEFVTGECIRVDGGRHLY